MQITESEKDALAADILRRLHTLAEGHPVPREFLTVWLPMIVGGAVQGYAESLEEAAATAPVEFHEPIRAMFDWEGFCADDRMFGVSRSTNIWMAANT